MIWGILFLVSILVLALWAGAASQNNDDRFL